jgi:hypothetical protein
VVGAGPDAGAAFSPWHGAQLGQQYSTTHFQAGTLQVTSFFSSVFLTRVWPHLGGL